MYDLPIGGLNPVLLFVCGHPIIKLVITSCSVFFIFFAFLLIRQETVEQLLANIFDKEKNESAIVSVIQILLTLFETRRPA